MRKFGKPKRSNEAALDIVSRRVLVVLSLILVGCSYDASFSECTVHCDEASGCPEGLMCGNEGLCRSPGTETCSMVVETQPSCMGLAPTCGSHGTDDCCSTATPIPGGTYYRSYDTAVDAMYPSMNYPATVSAFRLDKYEVTVGRFRKFVEAVQGTQTNPPNANAGEHARIPGSGWDPSWNVDLVADTVALIAAVKCDAMYQTWTDAVGGNEDLPIDCVDWYEAMAFCAWDGGYLPTEAEWNFAAAAGDEQRAYPWAGPAGSALIDCSYANYDINLPSGTHCVRGEIGGVTPVGFGGSPKGDGKWGQSDLAGNAWEWTLDTYQTPYANPCNDCADLTSGTSGAMHVVRGGSFLTDALNLRTGLRFYVPSSNRFDYGIRCARDAQ